MARLVPSYEHENSNCFHRAHLWVIERFRRRLHLGRVSLDLPSPGCEPRAAGVIAMTKLSKFRAGSPAVCTIPLALCEENSFCRCFDMAGAADMSPFPAGMKELL